MFKVCFIGVGSIAKRHIENLNSIFRERGEPLQIDILRSGKGKTLDSSILSVITHQFTDVNDLQDNYYDTIFITNPTEYHLETLYKVHNKGNAFFIEKPIVSIAQIPSLKNFKLDENKLYYVACPLRYTKVIQFIKDNIDATQVYCARCISSSYLPDWRPGIDYRKTYSAQKSLGGGVSIDLIHEWDYIKYLFGRPHKVYKSIKKISALEINSEDIASYLVEYNDKIVELHLDYFGRKAIREIQLFTREDTIVCDLIDSKIKFLYKGDTIDLDESRNDYQKEELRYFLNIINKKKKNENTIGEAYQTLLLTQGELI